MAEIAKRLAANIPGEFFVDATCIDCGTCRQVAPETFAEGGDASYVHRQPADEAQAHRARMALVACPVAAIATQIKQRIAEARAAFPELIDDGVYYCGYAAESSYGARSYLIVRPAGNILVDSPRFAGPLVEKIGLRSAACAGCSSRTATMSPTTRNFASVLVVTGSCIAQM